MSTMPEPRETPRKNKLKAKPGANAGVLLIVPPTKSRG